MLVLQAFTGSELTVAKSRVLQLAGFQHSLDELWRSMRWTMDVITFARDRSAVGGLPLGILFAPPQQVIERVLTHSSAVSSTPRQVTVHNRNSYLIVQL
jgi:ABC-type proline/glycine betaine transport system permease subunit